MEKILIVENDIALAKSITTAISTLSVELYHTVSLAESYRLLEKDRFDLVILDRLLEDGDGLEIAEYLQDVSYPTQIIILSTVGDEQNRIKGLVNGADLYLAKPFNKKELLLLVKKALTTKKINAGQALSLGPISLSVNSGLVSTPESKSKLKRKEVDILKFLMIRKNQTVTRDQIIAGVWGSTIKIPTYSTIDAYIRKIRVHLGNHADHIKTVRGFGYKAIEHVI